METGLQQLKLACLKCHSEECVVCIETSIADLREPGTVLDISRDTIYCGVRATSNTLRRALTL